MEVRSHVTVRGQGKASTHNKVGAHSRVPDPRVARGTLPGSSAYDSAAPKLAPDPSAYDFAAPKLVPRGCRWQQGRRTPKRAGSSGRIRYHLCHPRGEREVPRGLR